MTSRLLSQIFDQNSTSIYETFNEHDARSSDESDQDDVEDRAGMMPIRTTPSYRPLSARTDSPFQSHPRSPIGESVVGSVVDQRRPFLAGAAQARRENHPRQQPGHYKDEDDSGDVPASLLFEAPAPQEDEEEEHLAHRMPRRPSSSDGEALPLGSRVRGGHASPPYNQQAGRGIPSGAASGRIGQIDPKERAMWKWANVENLDNFLTDVRTVPLCILRTDW